VPGGDFGFRHGSRRSRLGPEETSDSARYGRMAGCVRTAPSGMAGSSAIDFGPPDAAAPNAPTDEFDEGAFLALLGVEISGSKVSLRGIRSAGSALKVRRGRERQTFAEATTSRCPTTAEGQEVRTASGDRRTQQRLIAVVGHAHREQGCMRDDGRIPAPAGPLRHEP